MSDGKVTSVDSGAKKKAKRGGVGTKQVCGGLGESHTCIRSSNIPHTHAFGSVGISSGSIMAASEDVRRCQKMSENIPPSDFIVTTVAQRAPTHLPFTVLNQQTSITNFCTLIDNFVDAMKVTDAHTIAPMFTLHHAHKTPHIFLHAYMHTCTHTCIHVCV